MVYQVQQHQIKNGHGWWDYCKKVCLGSKNLYNSVQYSNRHSFFYGYSSLNLTELDKRFKDNEHYQALPAKVSQLVLKQAVDSWNGYYSALKSWKKNPSKFTGEPNIPGYIKSQFNVVKFNYQAIGKKEFSNGFIVPSKSPIKIPVKSDLNFEDLVEVRIIPKVGCFVIEVVYEIEDLIEKEFYKGLGASIDIGIDNLATIVFSDPKVTPLAINGKPLKSANQWMNKEVARLKSSIGFGTSIKIQNVYRNRNNYVHSYLHSATRRIADELDDIGVTHVAIGKNPQWKTNIAIGKKNNQSFVQIPHAKFISMLTQKLEKLGITVMVGEESYTSKASFLDWDSIPTWQPGKSLRAKFSGKRIETKKYRSKNKTVIHADVNGAFNIGRKVLPNFFDSLKSIVERDSGQIVLCPRRIDLRITHHNVRLSN